MSISTDGVTAEDRQTKAVKFDAGKPRAELLPPIATLEVVKVLTYGASKYTDHNWRLGFRWTRPIGASLRHIMAWLGGEDNDPETGINHLAHAACSLLFVIETQALDLGEDDRWTRGKGDTP